MEALYKIATIFYKITESIFNLTILRIGNNSINLTNILFSVIIILMGIKYYKRILLLINNYIKNKISSDPDIINIFENLVFYTFLSIYFLLILEIANIPLNIFAFIGGALAISLGLGAKTFIENFISSLIVMIQRPLKIGDIIELQDLYGTVESVGIRYTKIIGLNNNIILIPNNKIIDNILVNWTQNSYLIKYQAIFKIRRNNNVQFAEVEGIIDELKEILNNNDFIKSKSSKLVNLVKIETATLNFLVEFYCNAKTIEQLENNKNKFNLLIIKKFLNKDYTIEYLHSKI